MREALLRMLPESHKKRELITQKLKNEWTGFRGEKNVDYFLSFLPCSDYDILNGLSLEVNNKTFQIDTLVLTPFVFLVIETKNIYGILFFDQLTNQVIRITEDNQREVFPNPLLQAKRHAQLLREWMEFHKLKPRPIEHLVAIGNSSTLLKTNPGMEQIFEKILHAEYIPGKITEIESQYKDKGISLYLLQKIVQLLQQENHPKPIDILEHYEISPTELTPLFRCPQCNHAPLIRDHITWCCTKCRYQDKAAHTQVITDHLLIHHTITNAECRKLLSIQSPHLAKRILQSLDLPFQGRTNSRTYHLPPHLIN